MALTEEEIAGVEEIKRLREEYLSQKKASELVREFLINADDQVLIQFLRGRKYRADYAWETLKKNGEVRFDSYPDFFPETLPEHLRKLQEDNIVGVLKGRTSEGQRILVFNASAWDPDKFNLEDLSKASICWVDGLVKDEDCMRNGFICVIQASGLGFKHARHYGLSVVRKLIKIFMYSYPLQWKGIYYMNVPYLMRCVLNLVKPLLPKKIKDRFFVTSEDQGYETLHQRISPDILPKFLGGDLEFHELIDSEIC